MAAGSRTQIHMCAIVTSQTWKMDERKGVDDDHEDIEKKVSNFHILNGILAKTRNVISKKGFLVVSWIPRRWRIDNAEPRMYGNTISRISVKSWAANKKLLWELQESRRPDVNMI